MNIDGILIERHSEGWAVKIPREGKDKHGNPKTHYRESYFPRLTQCLGFIRDRLSGECQTVVELIALLNRCEDIDKQVLAQSGLSDVFKSEAA